MVVKQDWLWQVRQYQQR